MALQVEVILRAETEQVVTGGVMASPPLLCSCSSGSGSSSGGCGCGPVSYTHLTLPTILRV